MSPADRIATFDYDGTLWCEKPTYVQADFFLGRMREMIAAEPALTLGQPYKAVDENDQEYLAHLLDHAADLAKAVTEAYAGITTEAFEQAVGRFFVGASHPTLTGMSTAWAAPRGCTCAYRARWKPNTMSAIGLRRKSLNNQGW